MEDEIIAKALKKFKVVQSAEALDRPPFIEDLEFTYNVNDGQWPEEVKKDRKNRPCLTANKLRKFVSQVANRERDMRMAMKVRPVDNLGDDRTAAIYDGLLRHIE